MSKKVLVIFPDEGMLDFLKSVLSLEGGDKYEVETEWNLKKALEAIERSHPDLLLMEAAPLNLGIGHEEFQVLTEIRKRYPDLKIVILIDCEEKDLIERAKQMGVEDYLIKFDIEETLTVVRKKLGNPSP